MTAPNVINFRASDRVLELLAEATEGRSQKRSGVINFVLDQALDPKRQSFVIEKIVGMIHREDEENGPSEYGDNLRSMLHGAKWMLQHLLGDPVKDSVVQATREKFQKPFPHVGPRAPDGRGRFGFDMDAG